MKILQLVTKRQYRGAEVFAANLSSELLMLGHNIIFAGLYNNDCNILEVRGAINLDLTEKKTGGFSINLVKEIISLVKNERPEIIQCNGSDTLKYMVAASYFLPKTPIVYRNISVISEWIDGSLKLNLYKYLFKRIDHVTSVGSESIQDLITTLNYPKNQTSVIRRGIPLKNLVNTSSFQLRRTLGLRDSDKLVMHIGNFSPEKNHEFLLDIFSDLKIPHPDIKLVLVGTGISYEKVIEKIHKLGLVNTVFPIGFRKDIPELLAQVDCFALCSKVEGVPGVILEAGSQKKPSISTNVGGVKEVLVDNETGYIIENFDKKEFAWKLVQLVNNRKLNAEMGNNAYKLVVDEFNPEKNAKKFEKLYAGLLIKKTQILPENREKLKILQLIQKKQFRGAEVFASQLSTHLLNAGNSVEIVSIYDGKADLPFPKDIKTLDRKKSNRGFDFMGWKKLAYIIKEMKPDVIQANASDTLKYAVLSKILFRWKTPIVYRNASTSSFYITNSFSKYFNSFLLKRVDLVVSVSRASLEDLSKLFPFVQSKSLVIPVGVEDIFFSDKKLFPQLKQRYNLLHIGSFTREKNHEGLLRIFKTLLESKEDLFLNLVGSGPLLEEIKKKVVELNIVERVIFHSEINDPREFYQDADALVLPSLVEGLPGVVLEAMASRIPVIAYNVGGVSEILTEETGFAVPPGNELKFGERIMESLKEVSSERMNSSELLVKNSYRNKTLANRFEIQYLKVVKSLKIH